MSLIIFSKFFLRRIMGPYKSAQIASIGAYCRRRSRREIAAVEEERIINCNIFYCGCRSRKAAIAVEEDDSSFAAAAVERGKEHLYYFQQVEIERERERDKKKGARVK